MSLRRALLELGGFAATALGVGAFGAKELLDADEAEQRWAHLPSPMDGRPIWAVAQSPHDARVLLAACRPTARSRSRPRPP